jgi:hydrogenase maturation protease
MSVLDDNVVDHVVGDIVVVGLGNPDRGDDAVGRLLAARLVACGLAGVRVETLALDAAEILEAWSGADEAILLDCVRSGSPVGTVHCVDPFDGSYGVHLESSTHALGARTAVELGRALEELPRRLALVGIEGTSFVLGEPPSAEVCAAIPEAVRVVRDLITRWRRSSPAVTSGGDQDNA